MKLAIGVLAAAALLAGCSKSSDLYPLKEGIEFRYISKGQLGQFLHEVRVTRPYPVAKGQGWELTGSLGDSILSWQGSTLYASVLAGTRYNPPMPLVDGSKKETTLTWKGNIFMAGKLYKAKAETEQKESDFNGKKAIETDLLVDMGQRKIKVNTVYVRGRGPVTQKQWLIDGINETYDFGIELIGEPSR